ncbi:MAG: hypothetical protein O2812_01195 [Chloroflexi bacterium]|nr:hypothetical protein [Chloroflexota bacterium]
MNVEKWIWCLHCERCFEVHLSREPEWDDAGTPPGYEIIFNFAPDFEMQLGIERNGNVYAECPYENCDGDLKDFWWWDNFHSASEQQHLPETPEVDKVYPLYP